MALGERHALRACSSFVKQGQCSLCRVALRLRERLSPEPAPSLAHIKCYQISHPCFSETRSQSSPNKASSSHRHRAQEHPLAPHYIWEKCASPLSPSGPHLPTPLSYFSCKCKCAKKSDFLISNLYRHYSSTNMSNC